MVEYQLTYLPIKHEGGNEGPVDKEKEKAPRILFVSEQFDQVGGIPEAFKNHARALSQTGCNISFLVPSPSLTLDRETTFEGFAQVHEVASARIADSQRVPLHWRTPRRGQSIGLKEKVRQILDTDHPTVIHLETIRTAMFHVLGLRSITDIVIAEAKKRNIPIIASGHSLPANVSPYVLGLEKPAKYILRGWLKDIEKAVLRIAVPTNTAKRLHVRYGFPEDRIDVVSNGIQLDQYTQPSEEEKKQNRLRYGINPDIPVILYAGRIAQEKRLDILIDTVYEVLRRQPDLRFQFVFFGNDDRQTGEVLKAQVAMLGLDTHVLFRGGFKPEERNAVYSTADIFAISSPHESQSIVTMEAMACGLPVIATNSDALPELVTNNENGLLISGKNRVEEVNRWADALITMLEHPEKRTRMGRASLQKIQLHDLYHTGQQLIDTYARAGIPEFIKLQDEIIRKAA